MARTKIGVAAAVVSFLCALLATPAQAANLGLIRWSPVPLHGAYVGGFVNDDHGVSETTQIRAFEADTGRTLDIDNTYRCFGIPVCGVHDGVNTGEIIDNPTVTSDLNNGRIPLISWGCSTKPGWTLLDIIKGYNMFRAPGGVETPVIQYLLKEGSKVKGFPDTVFIRWQWEMLGKGASGKCVQTDGGPANYTQAWKDVYTLFKTDVGATNASFVWCPSASDFSSTVYGSAAHAYYPGNPYVDYVCADGYNRADQAKNFGTIFGNAYQYAVQVAAPAEKPFMVGETGDEATNTGSQAQGPWITAFFSAVQQRPDVKAVLYWDSFNCSTQNDYSITQSAGKTASAPVAALHRIVSSPYFNTRGSSVSTPTTFVAMTDSFKPGCEAGS